MSRFADSVEERVPVAEERAEQEAEVVRVLDVGVVPRQPRGRGPRSRAGRCARCSGSSNAIATRRQQHVAVGRADLLPADLALAEPGRLRQRLGVAPCSRPCRGTRRRQVAEPEPVVRRDDGRAPGLRVPQRPSPRGRPVHQALTTVTGAPSMLMTRSPATTSSMFLYVASAISTRVPAAKQPGPTPTFTPSTPASTSACAPARVATLPPSTCTCRVAGSALSRRTMSSISRA